MADASYEKQHLALHAAGFINGAGTTQTTFGCQMTRLGLGSYAMLLDDSAGLVNDESFTFATVKGPIANPKNVVVQDTSNQVKTITVFDNAPSNVNGDIEVALFKSVTH
jgi:hypothetical protein